MKLVLIHGLLPLLSALRNEYYLDIYIFMFYRIWLLVFMTGILRTSFYLGHRHLLCWLILWCEDCWNTRSFVFQRQRLFIFCVTNLRKEMRCFISKDLNIKMCLWEILPILHQIICIQVQKCLPGSNIWKLFQWYNIIFSNCFQSNSSVQCSEL